MAINAVDVLILAVVGLLAVLGIRRGFLLGALDLVGVAAGLVVAAVYYRRLIDPLTEWGLGRGTAAIIAFATFNLAALFAVSLVTGFLFRPLSRLPWPWLVRWGDGLLGVLPGVIKGLAIAAVVVLPLAFLQRPLLLSSQVRASQFALPLVDAGLDAIYGAVDRFGIDLADFAVITARPAGERVDLPFTVTDGLVPDRTAEAELLALVNQERATVGLPPVAADPELTAVGRDQSAEMFRLGYFAHDSPLTGSPGQRLDAAGVPYLLSGENLAYAPTVAVAHEGLMNSPAHRENILNPAFTRLGVGVVRSPNRGMMISQEFAA